MTRTPIDRLILLGATGDLTGRYLLPALAELMEAGELPHGFEVIGGARSDLDDASFRELAAGRLEEHAPDIEPSVRQDLLEVLHYRRVDLESRASIAELLGEDDRAAAVYLALPPSTYETALRGMAAVGLPPGSRLVFEKPFGEDLESSVALNDLLAELTNDADTDAVFRVDHVLGLATVHNLIGARLANRVLEPLWNSTHIQEVRILWDETIALEGRAGYYDGTGAMEDVVQNHLIQIFCLLAMEPPAELHADGLSEAKVEVLRSVRIPSVEQAARQSRRARYTAGRLAPPPEGSGAEVPSYVDEDGVDPSRGTETFAEIVLEIDNDRWSGTPFVLRTGKALGARHKGVVVRFRPTAGLPFDPGTAPPCNELHIGLDGPESFTLHLTGSAPGPPPRLVPLTLAAELPAHELPAYSHVLLDVLRGENTLSIGADEAELAWAVVTPFARAWADGAVPLQDYPAGSDGPTDSLV